MLRILAAIMIGLSTSTSSALLAYEQPTSAETRELRSRWGQAIDLWGNGEFHECQKAWKSITQDAARIYGGDHQYTLEARTWIKRCDATLTWDSKQLDRLEALRSFLTNRKKVDSRASEKIVWIKKRIEQCELLLQDANALFGEKSVDSAKWRSILAEYCIAYGDYSRAHSLLESSAIIYRDELSDRHGFYMAQLVKVVDNTVRLGNVDVGLQYAKLGKKYLEKTDRPAHEKSQIYFVLQFKVVQCHLVAHEYDRALESLEELQRFVSEKWLEHSQLNLKFLVPAARCFAIIPGQQKSAREYINRATEAARSVNLGLNEASEYRARCDEIGAHIALLDGQWTNALGHAQKAIDALDPERSALQRKTLFYAQCSKAEALAKTGKLDAANRSLAAAVELRNRMEEVSPFSDYASAANLCCRTARKVGALKAAEELALEAIKVYEQRVGRDYHRIGNVLEELGSIRHAQKRFPESANYFKRALTIQTAVFGNGSRAQLSTLRVYKAMLTEWGQRERAEEVAARVSEIERQ